MFFDMEGIVLEGDSLDLIKEGRLANVFTDRKTAKQYHLPHTGAASGEYDDIPSLSDAPLAFAVDSDDMKTVLDGKPAVLVIDSSGGDFTSDGSFAAPVQMSFLFDGEKVLGKLPEFTMRSHLYQMLGDDYIGTFDGQGFYFGDGIRLQGYYMQILP